MVVDRHCEKPLIVIANQSSDWCGNLFLDGFTLKKPHSEGIASFLAMTKDLFDECEGGEDLIEFVKLILRRCEHKYILIAFIF